MSVQFWSVSAVEPRDHDDARYAGQGVRSTVHHVNGPIADTLVGRPTTACPTNNDTSTAGCLKIGRTDPDSM